MATEVLAVPEESLEVVIAIIREGLARSPWAPPDVVGRLTDWCDEEEEYLRRIGAPG